jgi:hypothetical protein
VYPGANGVKTINGGWDNSQNKEYIFQRINDWLLQYFGENHGISIGLTENAINTTNPNIISVVYASMLGTFANNGVEIFTPWSWKTGMWETLHLFSRYAKTIKVNTSSSLDATVSGYTTISSSVDSMTVILVNRDLSASRTVTVNIAGFSVSNGSYNTLGLSSLPADETFISHSSNALKSSTVSVSGNSFNITLPAVSTTAVILTGTGTGIEQGPHVLGRSESLGIIPNPVSDVFKIHSGDHITGVITLKLTDLTGNIVLIRDIENDSELSLSGTELAPGVYIVTTEYQGVRRVGKLVYTASTEMP